MSNPLINYKSYHTNKINICIHQCCIPLLMMSMYSIFPKYVSFGVNLFYSTTYLLFDVFSKKSVESVYYLQSITNVLIHTLAWIAQIVGHKWFENNSPAFVENLYNSFLFGPYFTFLETFHPHSFKPTNKYSIVQPNFDKSKKSIIYFAGLFQKSDVEYEEISHDLKSHNHIYVNVHFNANDVYKDTLLKIKEDLEKMDLTIECMIGFSFGGSLCLQLKELYCKDIQTILISPGGFKSSTFFEKMMQFVSKWLYFLYCNDKWFMISNYPLYQNIKKLSETDVLIVSNGDSIHNHWKNKDRDNLILFKNVSHSNMISIIKKQKIISQLIKTNYVAKDILTKSPSSFTTKLLFGSHFYPYHISLWVGVSCYYLYKFVNMDYGYADLVNGFMVSSFIYSLIDYGFHSILLHNHFYEHHNKHHVYPNKLSIIHCPMSIVVVAMFALSNLLQLILKTQYCMIFHIIGPIYYLTFEFTHLLTHSYRGSNKIILNAKYYHKLHHVEETTNYGVVTPYWDYLLGTLSPKYTMNFAELVFGFIPFYSFLIHKTQTQE